MTPASLAVGAIFGVILANQLVMRFGGAANRVLYVSMQSLNVAMAVCIAVVGVPGLERSPGSRFALAGVFVFRAVWNHHEVTTAHREAHRIAMEAERDEILAKLHGDEEADPEEEAP